MAGGNGSCCSSGPSIGPGEQGLLPGIVPVKSPGADGDQPEWQCAEFLVPVAATIVPVLSAGAYRHYRGAATAVCGMSCHGMAWHGMAWHVMGWDVAMVGDMWAWRILTCGMTLRGMRRLVGDRVAPHSYGVDLHCMLAMAGDMWAWRDMTGGMTVRGTR